MTGFGRSEGNTTLGKVYVETRSVNHRYSDINLKLPKRLTPFEMRIKEMIKSDVSRGRIDVSLRLDSTGEGKVELDVDFDAAEQYYRALQTLKEKFNLSGDITVQVMAGAKDLITAKEEQEDVEPYWQEIAPIVKQSFRSHGWHEAVRRGGAHERYPAASGTHPPRDRGDQTTIPVES